MIADRWIRAALLCISLLQDFATGQAAAPAAGKQTATPTTGSGNASAPAISLHHTAWTTNDGAPTIIMAMTANQVDDFLPWNCATQILSV